MEPIPEAQREALEAQYQRLGIRAADISGSHAWLPCQPTSTLFEWFAAHPASPARAAPADVK
ncbi:hypothetical protein JY651_05510 [Pyxidicoccus parkwayensis]|uniref:Uncharacterized protein n=1 Tax=Pyxidicoccus parkwayensis TaxID=2813578 RepID=A0ABX7P252_9BACT|nr:hypothetical protein [Pyxidicoccus parkwaysis]QSQ24415.1 hypothetical protein JY651_05510 [Pyxidicoccus parkwaysis]